MKVKLRITVSDTMVVDTDHYDADTPEGVAAEQLKFFEEEDGDLSEVLGLGDDYQQKVEVVSDAE